MTHDLEIPCDGKADESVRRVKSKLPFDSLHSVDLHAILGRDVFKMRRQQRPILGVSSDSCANAGANREKGFGELTKTWCCLLRTQRGREERDGD
jgi:hypothetical protein